VGEGVGDEELDERSVTAVLLRVIAENCFGTILFIPVRLML